MSVHQEGNPVSVREGNPVSVSNPVEMRCRFIILARKDEPTPDYGHRITRKYELTPDYAFLTSRRRAIGGPFPDFDQTEITAWDRTGKEVRREVTIALESDAWHRPILTHMLASRADRRRIKCVFHDFFA
ncbi:MAG: hypothetical protein ACLQU5_22395 [Isosphaeraceae bacterium]